MNSIKVFIYLINKLEYHHKKFSIFLKNELNRGIELEKKELFNFFKEIETDLEQAAFSIKSLLYEKKINCEEKININIEELKKKNDVLFSENENLKKEIAYFINFQEENKPTKNINQNVNSDFEKVNINELIFTMKRNKSKVKEVINNYFNKSYDFKNLSKISIDNKKEKSIYNKDTNRSEIKKNNIKQKNDKIIHTKNFNNYVCPYGKYFS